VSKFGKYAGWTLTVLGVICVLLLGVTFLDPHPTAAGARPGLIMLALLFGVPGGIVLWRWYKKAREHRERAELLGTLRTRDRISVSEIAGTLGRSEAETERLIVRMSEEERLDLVFDASSRQFLHRARVSAPAAMPDKCPTCGGPLQQKMVVAGERVTCDYCGSPVGEAAQ
jgi:hypothetical protein